jgi:cobalt-zinc-cadmium efflux system protein
MTHQPPHGYRPHAHDAPRSGGLPPLPRIGATTWRATATSSANVAPPPRPVQAVAALQWPGAPSPPAAPPQYGHVPGPMAHAPAAPAPAPAPVFPRGPAHGHSHSHGHSHAHANGHGHAHGPAPRATELRAAGHSHGGEHAAAHGHSHGHGSTCSGHGLLDHHHDYTQIASSPRNRKLLAWATGIQALFLVAEVVGGIAFGSLALLSDAAHMLADVGALALALVAIHLVMRPVTSNRTYGFGRAEPLAAFVNGLTLVASCLIILVEAVRRLQEPSVVEGGGVAIIAAAGLVANLATAAILSRADQENVNIKAAMLHTMVDAASSVAVLLSGVLIAITGMDRIDVFISVVIALLAIRGTWWVLRESMNSLLDAAPAHVQADAAARRMLEVRGVTEVHDLHVWSLGSNRHALTAHVLVRPGHSPAAVVNTMRKLLRDEFQIDHATLETTLDFRLGLHQIIPAMPIEHAALWAVQYLSLHNPGITQQQAEASVMASLAGRHWFAGQRTSPIRLVSSAKRVLDGAA